MMDKMLASMLGIDPAELQKQVMQFAQGMAGAIKDTRDTMTKIQAQNARILELLEKQQQTGIQKVYEYEEGLNGRRIDHI